MNDPIEWPLKAPGGAPGEGGEARLKRLSMRSHRRGTREMDLVLGPFAVARLPDLTATELDLYEALLEENDQDLYLWIASRAPGSDLGPEPLRPLLDRIAVFAQERLRTTAL
jgi:antitoxin CptB